MSKIIFKSVLIISVFMLMSFTAIAKTNTFAKIYCFFVPGSVREVKDFKKINVREIQDTDGKKVVVSGIRNIFDSALTIYKSKSKRIENEVNVEVIFNLTGGQKGDPMRFEEIITLDDKIDKITFGKERNIIWDRSTYIHKDHIFIKSGRIELNPQDMDDITLKLKDIAFKEVKNRNLELEKYIYVYFSERSISKGAEKGEYTVSFSSKDWDLYPYHKGNLSKEYPNFTVYIDKESLEVSGFYLDK